MKIQSSAIHNRLEPLSVNSGFVWGMLGVLAFSFTVPLTRIAVQHGAMSPLFVGSGRAVVAALLAAGALAVTRQRLPRGAEWGRLLIVAGGVVIGFPLLTTYALTTTSAAHSAVVIALLPAATAVVSVLRTGERPPSRFWFAAALGAVAAVAFAGLQGDGLGTLHISDLLLIGAVVAAAVGYAEGGLLTRELGAWQTISWALVAASPLMVALTAVSVATGPPVAGPTEWASFAYLAAVSMFLGSFAWYRGLAIGPMAQVSQTQLTQPVLSILWAALLLHERLTWPTVLGGGAVVVCALSAVRSRTGNPGATEPASSPHADARQSSSTVA
ncbi:DMT family transporter [Mycolicibacterium mucogenicum]|uniref:DMT family transporter n=1 Tax=Mycolicibacterium mucogenicum TaxID=56689 RepID=A0A4R5WLA8_MYCMU|nr:DMT family transporter [Mycolicibacterium mucogenicum]